MSVVHKCDRCGQECWKPSAIVSASVKPVAQLRYIESRTYDLCYDCAVEVVPKLYALLRKPAEEEVKWKDAGADG